MKKEFGVAAICQSELRSLIENPLEWKTHPDVSVNLANLNTKKIDFLHILFHIFLHFRQIASPSIIFIIQGR